MKLLSTLLFIASASVANASSLRGATGNSSTELFQNEIRQLETSYYYTTSDLGKANHMAALGNPLKGLLTSPRWTGGNTRSDQIPSSLEFYYIGLDEIMKGNNQFDWTVLDKSITDAASRNNHVIWRIFCHYPGEPLRIPEYLLKTIKLVPIKDGGVSPQYDDPILLAALKSFIVAFGKRYDGHKSVAVIQLGLLGYWGEWHTYPDDGLISSATQDSVVGWYSTAFKKTKLQSRSSLDSVYKAGIGLHDDSFAYSTLGSEGWMNWFFWPQVENKKMTDFWKKSIMGGETRPELQGSVFDPSYVPGSDPYKQDFNKCVQVTHATYMFHHWLFIAENMPTAVVNNARNAHAKMGYNFQVTNVGASASSDGLVSVDVTVKQTGVAPFYYPLSLELSCPGTTEILPGVDTLIDTGSTKVFSFQGIPADSACLQDMKLTLESNMAYDGKPIKFAQGDGTVSLKLPMPNGASAGSAEVEKPRRKPISVLMFLLNMLRIRRS